MNTASQSLRIYKVQTSDAQNTKTHENIQVGAHANLSFKCNDLNMSLADNYQDSLTHQPTPDIKHHITSNHYILKPE